LYFIYIFFNKYKKGGVLSRRFGGKWVLMCGVITWSIFTLLTPPAALLSKHLYSGLGLFVLFLVRIGMGAGEGVNFPAVHDISGVWAPKSEITISSSFIVSGNSNFLLMY
jgi:ACS family sodium-dependent inorganic phosphate cotransporter